MRGWGGGPLLAAGWTLREGHPSCAFQTPLTQKSAWKITARVSCISSWESHARRSAYTQEESTWESARRSHFLATGIRQIQTHSASEMSSFVPLDCARVKLALALIKTCRHLEWGPQKPVTPPTSLSQANQPSPMHSFHLGEGRTSPFQPGALRAGC